MSRSSSLHPTRLLRGPASSCQATSPPQALPLSSRLGTSVPGSRDLGHRKDNKGTHTQPKCRSWDRARRAHSRAGTRPWLSRSALLYTNSALHHLSLVRMFLTGGELHPRKREEEATFKLHLSAKKGTQSPANKTAVGATMLPSRAAGDTQLLKAGTQHDYKARGHTAGLLQQHRSRPGPAKHTAGRRRKPSKGQPYLQAAAVTSGTQPCTALVPLTQGHTGASPRPTRHPHKATAAGCHREHPSSPPALGKRPNGSERSAGQHCGVQPPSHPPPTARTETAGTEVKERGGGARPTPRHSQAEHALHVLDLPATELLELGVGVEAGRPAGLRRALVDVVPPGQLSAQLRARAGRQAAPLLLARLGWGRDRRFLLIALRLRGPRSRCAQHRLTRP